MGVFITRGVDADGLDLEKKWDFVATASKGDDVLGGQVIGTVQETDTITHKIMVPPKASGKIKSIKSEISTSLRRYAPWKTVPKSR